MYNMAPYTKEKLIAATQSLLWERGYEGTSPAAILERSGSGQGSLYHHFEGKSALAAAAMTESLRMYGARTDEQLAVSQPGSAVDHLCAFLAAPRETLRGCRFGRLANEPAVLEDPAVLAPVRGYFLQAAERITKVVALGQAAGEIARTIPAEDLAAMLLAVVQGGYVLSRVNDDPEQMSRASQAAVALLRSHVVSTGAGR